VPTAGGQLTIFGLNFGDDATQVSIFIDGTQCMNAILLVSQTTLECTMPPGIGQNFGISVTVDTLFSYANTAFSYLGTLLLAFPNNLLNSL
jgi:IPT/TIG domain